MKHSEESFYVVDGMALIIGVATAIAAAIAFSGFFLSVDSRAFFLSALVVPTLSGLSIYNLTKFFL